MSLNSREFEKLVRSTTKLQLEYKQFLNKFLLEMGMRALGKTKQLTPRDKGGGGGLVSRWELSSVYMDEAYLCIDIINPLEYASFVEDGHMQRARFLPLGYLMDSPKGKKVAASARAKYGPKTNGIMLKDKWIVGRHMARIAIADIEKQLPARYDKAFEQFLSELEMG